MKKIKYYILPVIVSALCLQSCSDLTEKTYSNVDASIYYQNEKSVKGAIASIYKTGFMSYVEYFWYLAEFPSDQITWRCWNGGLWGYDEGAKYVLGIQNWSSSSVIIGQTWNTAWQTIGLCNQTIYDLQNLNPANLNITQQTLNKYIAEIRTLRAWAYYNIFEVWGGALPLVVGLSTDIPPSADPDFDTGCKKIYNFLIQELDETVNDLPVNEVSRMNQAVNRMIKARLLFNAQVFIKEDHYAECANICSDIIANKYGTYSIAKDYRNIYSVDNYTCPEVIMAFAAQYGQIDCGWMRNMPFLPYNYNEYVNGAYQGVSGWNCVCLVPSFDNSGTINSYGGTSNPKSFLSDPYNDKLGAVWARLDDRDIRKQVYKYDYTTGKVNGMFLLGPMKANFGTGDPLKADADRPNQDLVYVDQVGTFLNKGRNLEAVMSPRWGETNSGIRMIKYPILPTAAGTDFRNAGEVEFRLAEVYFMLAECKMRSGDANGAKDLVNAVRYRYFSTADWATAKDQPGPGFTAFDSNWMLSQWGLEFLGEGRRRRTDLRRYDKFTQGQWWFHGRTSDDGVPLPAKRDRKFEWYPLPQEALLVNPGLVQNPNYK